jgi:hypothetical protein
MPKKVERRDTNILAFDIVQQATGQKPTEDAGKTPAAATLRRLGGAQTARREQKRSPPAKRKATAKKAAPAR